MSAWWLRLTPHLRGEQIRLLRLFGLAILGVGLQAVLPWPLKLIIDNVLGDQPWPTFAQWALQLPAVADHAGAMLGWLVLAFLLICLARMLQQLLSSVLQAELSGRLRLALAARVFDRLQQLALAYHRRNRKGDLLHRVTSDTDCMPQLISGVLLPSLTSALALLTMFAIMWQLDSQLALIAAFVALPMSVLIRWLGPRMSERAYRHQQAEGVLWSTAEQALTAIPVIQAFGRETVEGRRFAGVAERSISTYLGNLAAQIQFRVGVDASEALGLAAVMLVGGLHVIDGSISVGTLVVFLSYVAALYEPLLTFAYMAPTVTSAAGSARRVFEVLDASESIVESAGAKVLLPARPGGAGLSIRFEQVAFGYRADQPVLDDISLQIEAGQTLALVGASGAGKSTLAALIPRLHDPWRGRLLVGGHDLRELTLASLREQIAFVLQDPFILPLSIADNIAYARPSASVADIEAAARSAGADEFIRDLPHGYQTVIGEGGVDLSGGQRQRLSIARALLKNAPILIMDEPTSALDVFTERGLVQALRRLSGGRTTLLIAHRLSTVQQLADRVAVLEDRRIVATGSHAHLLASCLSYRSLFAAPAASGAN